MMGKGYLKVELFVGDQVLPVGSAAVLVKEYEGNVLHNLVTDEHGHTNTITLEAPDKNTDPNTEPRFATYDVEVPAIKGMRRVIIHGIQIFDTITTILPVHMTPMVPGTPPAENIEEIYIPREHGVDINRGEPGLMEEASVPAMPMERPGRAAFEVNPGPMSLPQTAPFALPANEVAIPEYITVHLGSPNATARNVRVPFKDYVKNVASSEIFPTWETAAIQANIYAQISFVLNRVYTVWYRSRGKDFDITNNTAFDQFFVEGRDFFQNISQMVDNIFNNFLRRQGRQEPFFASYCNGTTSTCAGLSQWGSQYLAQQGYSPIQILRYYYPDDIQIVESTNFTNNVGTFPGASLQVGSSGESVRLMQAYLNRISGNWYIPAPGFPDGIFGVSTKNSVMAFQQIFNLSPDGVIGRSTWYEITKIYVAVKELAELSSEGERISVGASPPTTTVAINDRGEYVVELQFLLNFISLFYPSIPFVVESGVFRDDTKRAVVEFQSQFGLTPDGVVGPTTWRKLYDVYHAITGSVDVPNPPPVVPSIPPFPGVALRLGSTGSDVMLMQNYLNTIALYYPAIPALTADGSFGPLTQTAVRAFQQQFGLTVDGVIGQITWYKIVDIYNALSYAEVPPTGPIFPGTALRVGSRGEDVRIMQSYLSAISKVFPVVPGLTADGVFGTGTQSSVIAFQRFFGLTPDGVIGQNTWNKIVSTYNHLPQVYTPTYPGTALRVGSSGNNVTIMQKYLNSIAARYPSIPTVVADGIFGTRTEDAVKAFQRYFGLTADGVIGASTWNMIVSVYNSILMNNPVIAAAGLAVDGMADETASVFHREPVGGMRYPMDKIALLLALSLMKK